jgi:hypothetical protein
MNLRRLYLLAIAALIGATAYAQEELLVPDTLQFAPAERFTFTVFATTDDIAPLQVQVRDFKLPNGQSRPSPIPAVTIQKVTTGGEAVTLAAPATAFPDAGDYRLTLLFSYPVSQASAPAKQVHFPKLMTVSRTKSEISAPGLKDFAVRIRRNGLWWPGNGTFDFELMNSGGEVNSLKITGGAINVETEPKELGRGKVAVLMTDGKTPLTQLKPGKNEAKLTLNEFPRTGTFVTRLVIERSAEQPAESIPFKVIVSDGWVMPFLAILAGVTLAFLVNLLATYFKPAQEIHVRVLQLSAEVVDAGAASRDLATQHAATELLNDLRTVDAEVSFVDAATSRARLDAIELRVDTMRTATFALVNEVHSKRGGLSDRIALLKRSAGTLERQAIVEGLEKELAALDEPIKTRTFDRARELADILWTAVEKARIDFAQPAVKTRSQDAAVSAGIPPPSIVVSPDAPHDGEPVTLSVSGAADGAYTWKIGDGDPQRGTASLEHTFFTSGTFVVEATPDGGETIRGTVVVARTDFSGEIEATRQRWWTAEALLSAIGLIVATVTGLWILWVDKTFGSASQYIEALLWGVGMDSTVRGVATAMRKLGGGA